MGHDIDAKMEVVRRINVKRSALLGTSLYKKIFALAPKTAERILDCKEIDCKEVECELSKEIDTLMEEVRLWS